MITLNTQHITVTCTENGKNLTLIDERRGTRWLLDEKTLIFGDSPDRTQQKPLLPVAARAEDNDTLIVTYQAGDVTLAVNYALHDAYVEVRLPAPTAGEVRLASLPGSFTPVGESLKLLLPIMQGMLWDGRGHKFTALRAEGSHLGFSMPFIGYLGQSGGLLAASETRDDQLWWFGKETSGRFWATNVQVDSLGSLGYERVVRLYPTDADIVAVAKCYRQRVKEMGRFITWKEKLEKRPALERLFGALMCFIGYCRDDLDYVAECKKLQAYGFDRALFYPIRFNIYYPDIHMGGEPAINLDCDVVAGIKALGYDVAPWTWLNEALDDSTDRIHAMFRKNPQGEIIKHWAIDDQQWYQICYSFIEEYQKDALNNGVADITWDHFDVLGCVPPQECYALDHPNHLGRPMSRSEEREWIRRAFLSDHAKGLMVSSESFNDAYSLELDFGSVKAWPQYGPWPFWPVPLTMLVYHDSMIHSWWELHSYNNAWRGRTKSPQHFEYGGGRPKLMAAVDALMGCPPDVFPFGAQYGYTGRGKETFLYKYRFEDPEVQLTLREALPVAKLHRKIGKQEMVHFKILSEDGYVQETAFADGTRVVANFSRDVCGGVAGIDHLVVEGIDSLMPESWQITE